METIAAAPPSGRRWPGVVAAVSTGAGLVAILWSLRGEGLALVGSAAVWIALGSTLYAIAALLYGLKRSLPAWTASGLNAALTPALFLSVALLALLVALVTHDFTLVYVVRNSSLDTPLLYRLSGLWGGQAGSLLFWTWMLSAFSALAQLRHRRTDPVLLPYAILVLSTVLAFFLLLVAAFENPFRTFEVPPPDGRGLNPLLLDPGMVVHPPLLYLGFVGFSVPYAFAMAALLTGRLDREWIVATRSWTLFAWAALSAGILAGGWWAYRVLGWGGYWGWDPVENASLLPWLLGTAYLHSALLQERAGIFAAWNMVLVILTFAMSQLGTFLTRTGLVASVHTFAQSEIATPFLVYLGGLLGASSGLAAWRWDRLRDRAVTLSLASREGAFLFNNVLFLGFAFAVLLGTLFPVLSEAVQGVQVFVGPPYFRQVSGPVGIALLTLMGIATLLPWRRGTRKTLLRFRFPLAALLAAGISAGVLLRRPGVVAALAAVAFTAAATLQEYHRGASARTARGEPYLAALWRLFQGRRYGGYLVHLAVLVMAVGIVGSHAYVREREATVRPGEEFRIGRYEITYRGLGTEEAPGVQRTWAELEVREGKRTAVLRPLRLYHPRWDQSTSRPAIRSTFREDLYVVLEAFESTGRVTLRAWVNPMVRWIWAGGVLFLIGTLITARPGIRRNGG
ncbi:MAG: heme lyase CcmF/NrfE family subunit [Armatimonadota bacterium]|nr:heme lyase CcmF/NrfE family subunit [Armatimonadota bacterium]MDR7444741.1 heme lyase CcmF/NrfE family subunit [Armatimonadota bacterium]MDR7571188.1 heme lyase CcmF/NrfE family subunit [Armatimonadota bacterium]MDR7613255.1 heme lyase CcmF/NrfE family subunit [Armatimonadota bacterium]